jgi:hypothetical protein
MPNLIFTDSAASTVVGTKGALGAADNAQPAAASSVAPVIRVTPIYLRVRYHLPYAIPALVAAALLLAVLAVAAVMHGGCSRLRRQMHQLAAGRIYTTFLYPGPGIMSTRSREWSNTLGGKVVDLTGEFPFAEQPLLDPHGHRMAPGYAPEGKVSAKDSCASAIPSPSPGVPPDSHYGNAQTHHFGQVPMEQRPNY